MSRINKFLMMMIAMVAIMIAAVGIDKGVNFYQAKKWEKERVAVYEKARKDVEQLRTTIKTLAEDPQALTAYIEENELNYVEVYEEEKNSLQVQEDKSSSGSSASMPDSVSGNSVSGNLISEESVSGNNVSGNLLPEGSVSGGSVSGNLLPEGSVSGSSVSGNRPAARKKAVASYAQTLQQNAEDKKIIKESTVDFSNLKITCLGDSITAATNLDNLENYEQYSYPARLKEILGAREVTNLGIGGSSIGRYWDNAFVDRYSEIPEDTDVIIIMGGTNDGFCATEEDLGSLDKREERSFAGDLDELMKGLKEDYPDAMIIFATPLPNVLHDILRKDRDNLLPQTAFVSMITQLSEEYEIPVIDLYYSGMLDTHDAAVIYNFMPDGVHANQAGYQILAEHIAAEIIQLYGQEENQTGNEKNI